MGLQQEAAAVPASSPNAAARHAATELLTSPKGGVRAAAERREANKSNQRPEASAEAPQNGGSFGGDNPIRLSGSERYARDQVRQPAAELCVAPVLMRFSLCLCTSLIACTSHSICASLTVSLPHCVAPSRCLTLFRSPHSVCRSLRIPHCVCLPPLCMPPSLCLALFRSLRLYLSGQKARGSQAGQSRPFKKQPTFEKPNFQTASYQNEKADTKQLQ